jgi:hypothetical protein
MPRAQTSNPSMTDVLLLLAMTMEFLHRLSDGILFARTKQRVLQQNLLQADIGPSGRL